MWSKFNWVETRPAPNAHSNHTREVKCFRRGMPMQGTFPPPEQEGNEIKLVVQAGLPSPTKDQTQQECLLPVRTINIKLARVQVRCIHSLYRRMYIYIYRFSEARRTKYFLYPFPNTTHMMGRGRRKLTAACACAPARKERNLAVHVSEAVSDSVLRSQEYHTQRKQIYKKKKKKTRAGKVKPRATFIRPRKEALREGEAQRRESARTSPRVHGKQEDMRAQTLSLSKSTSPPGRASQGAAAGLKRRARRRRWS